MSQMGMSADGGFASEAARQRFASRGDQQPSGSEQSGTTHKHAGADADDEEVPGMWTGSCSAGFPIIAGLVLDLVENFDDVSNSK